MQLAPSGLARALTEPHKLPLHLGFFEIVHNARRRGKALLGSLSVNALAVRRHPRIAVLHASIMHIYFAQESGPQFSGLVSIREHLE